MQCACTAGLGLLAGNALGCGGGAGGKGWVIGQVSISGKTGCGGTQRGPAVVRMDGSGVRVAVSSERFESMDL